MYARESTQTAPVPVEGLLWAVAALFFGLGDVATTGVGLTTIEVIELGPLVAPILHRFGLAAIVVQKLAIFAFSYLIWRIIPDPHRIGVPLGLALLGVFVTGWNLAVLYVAMVS